MEKSLEVLERKVGFKKAYWFALKEQRTTYNKTSDSLFGEDGLSQVNQLHTSTKRLICIGQDI